MKKKALSIITLLLVVGAICFGVLTKSVIIARPDPPDPPDVIVHTL